MWYAVTARSRRLRVPGRIRRYPADRGERGRGGAAAPLGHVDEVRFGRPVERGSKYAWFGALAEGDRPTSHLRRQLRRSADEQRRAGIWPGINAVPLGRSLERD